MSTLGAINGVVRELRTICGEQHVVAPELRPCPPLMMNEVVLNPGGRLNPSFDGEAVVSPGNAEEIGAVLRFANQRKLTVASMGVPPEFRWTRRLADIVLSTSRLTEVDHYDPGDLTVGIGAGCTVAQLSSMVGADGLLFAGDPAFPEQTTVGGMLATGITGPLRHGYGGLRDYCIGIRFVTGDGRVAKGGGRVVKNVAGYDLMKLLIGSQGTLAVITSASFKLFPAPRRTRTFVANFGTSGEAIQYRDTVLRSPLSPMCLELVSPEAGETLGHADFAAQWSICVRAAGSDAILSRYRADLGATALREIEGAEEQLFWRAVTDFWPNLRDHYSQSTVLLLSVPSSEVEAAIRDLTAVVEAGTLKLAVIGRVGLGYLLAGMWPGTGTDTNVTHAVSEISNRLSRDASLAILGGIDAVGPNDARLIKTPTNLKSMRAVKRALDPNEVLNRGRLAP